MLIGVLLSSLLIPDQKAVKDVLQQVSTSGRSVTVGERPDERVAPPAVLAPGAPPVLAFRIYEGNLHKRFEKNDLMLDDAGH